MRVYYFTNEKYGIENIEKRRVKLARINELNDPFEWGWLTSSDPSIRRAIERTKNHMASLTGLICFSRDWSNPVQWSHYADRHKGLCLGFDVPDKYLNHVEYTKTRKSLTSGTVQEIRSKLIRTKFYHWRYEKEVRLFEDISSIKSIDGLFFMNFSDNLNLREVVIGSRSSIKRADLTRSLGELYSVVKVKNARLSFRRYAVVTQQNPKFWV